MTERDKTPITRGDVPRKDDEKQRGVAGAHGDEGADDRSGALGVSHTRKRPEEIAPEKEVDHDADN